MIKQLHNLIIRTSNLEKLAKFYRGTLGLKVTQQNKSEVVFDLGGIPLVIHQGRTETKDKVGEGLVAPMSRTGFGVLVDDVDALYKHLKKAMDFPAPPQDEDWGARTVSGFDPDGNKIDFIEKKAVKS